jgi:hypothetical protein
MKLRFLRNEDNFWPFERLSASQAIICFLGFFSYTSVYTVYRLYVCVKYVTLRQAKWLFFKDQDFDEGHTDAWNSLKCSDDSWINSLLDILRIGDCYSGIPKDSNSCTTLWRWVNNVQRRSVTSKKTRFLLDKCLLILINIFSLLLLFFITDNSLAVLFNKLPFSRAFQNQTDDISSYILKDTQHQLPKLSSFLLNHSVWC